MEDLLDVDAGEEVDEVEGAEEVVAKEAVTEVVAEEEEPKLDVTVLQEERDALVSERDALKGERDTLLKEGIVAIAEQAGVLPQLLDDVTAKGFNELRRATSSVKIIERMLRKTQDEYEVGGKMIAREDLFDELDGWKDWKAQLTKKWEPKRKKLTEDTLAIFNLGLEAQKAKWVPGKPKSVEKSVKRAAGPKRTTPPSNQSGAKGSFGAVESEDDLIQIVAQQHEK